MSSYSKYWFQICFRDIIYSVYVEKRIRYDFILFSSSLYMPFAYLRYVRKRKEYVRGIKKQAI